MSSARARARNALRWWAITAVVAGGIVLALAGSASADFVRSDAAASNGVTSIAAGMSTTVTYTLIGNAANGDQNHCDADPSHPVVVTIHRPAGVMGSPSTLEFDDCGPHATQTATFSSNTAGTYPITHSFSGGADGSSVTNKADFSLTVNGSVSSNTAPSLNLPSDLTPEATSASGANVAFAVTASDPEDDPDPAASCSPGSGSVFPLGLTTVQCSVTDSGGLTTTGHFNVTVVDTTAPLLILPENLTAEATGPLGTAVTFGTSATDLVDGSVTPACWPLSGSTFALGTTKVHCSATDAHGNTATGSFDVTVQDTTPPTITLVSRTAANGNGWNNTDVTLEWSCSDMGSGVVSASVTKTVSAEGANRSATGTCTDLAGNPANDTQTGINIDKSAPTVVYTSANPAANAAGWNNTDVVATFTATDALSGFAGPSATKTGTSTTSGEGAAVSVGSPAFTDLAGNTALAGAATSDPFEIDKTAPTVQCGSADGNWHGADVSIACTAADSLSRLANAADASFSLTTSVAAGTETSNASTGSRTVYDAAGNATTAGPVMGNKVDRKAPSITCSAAPQLTIGQSPASVAGTAIDGGSGPGTQNVSAAANTSAIGSSSVTLSATDNVGNSATKSCSYSVIYGANAVRFLQPINYTAHDLGNNPDVSTFRAGSTVPTKVQVVLPNGTIAQPASALWITPQKGAATSQSVDEAVYGDAAASGSAYTWNSAERYYQYNWGTPKTGAGFYWLIGVKLDDGQVYSVYVSLR